MQPEFTALSPKTVLGIAAHPDDLDFGASGTLASFIRSGAEVYYLLVTDGSKGTADHSMTLETLIKTRRQEQRGALASIGGNPNNITFLDYQDGELELTMNVKRDIVKAIRTHRPDIVITLDPTVVYSPNRGMVNHPDHRVVGQATLDAVYPLARDHLSFPELYEAGYEPHKTPTVLMINLDRSNYYVDITDTMGGKLAALEAHPSQMGDMEKVHAQVKDMAATAGTEAGCTYAEGFMRIDLPV